MSIIIIIIFGVPKASLYCFQKWFFVWLHVCIYIYITSIEARLWRASLLRRFGATAL